MAGKILLQHDGDDHPRVFDAVVAVDAGVDHLFRHAQVTPSTVRDLVFGAIFTRSLEKLKNTAIFIGGSNVAEGEALLAAVQKAFVGPMRCSVLFDANGSNTTAAAAVLAAASHLPLFGAKALVLGTGPVGQRVVQLLALEGADVCIGSRSLSKAADLAKKIGTPDSSARLHPCETSSREHLAAALEAAQVVIAAGPPGVEMLDEALWKAAPNLKVLVDLNAVPPLGVGGVQVFEKAVERHGARCYGAVGVGGLKIKIHRAAVAKLFESNDQVLDAPEILALGKSLLAGG
ncbi:MAG TPA: NAD(P)-dependent methylenetetrahydromethanopterin dehydrogenase [Pirellulales bacterium]